MSELGEPIVADEYTPKVWDDAAIREAFIDDGGLSEYHDPIDGARTQRLVAGGIFDRWLAAHDEQVRREALWEAAQIAEDMPVVFDDTAYQAQEKIAAAIRAAAEREGEEK